MKTTGTTDGIAQILVLQILLVLMAFRLVIVWVGPVVVHSVEIWKMALHFGALQSQMQQAHFTDYSRKSQYHFNPCLKAWVF